MPIQEKYPPPPPQEKKVRFLIIAKVLPTNGQDILVCFMSILQMCVFDVNGSSLKLNVCVTMGYNEEELKIST